MTFDFTLYQDYLSVEDIIAANSATMDFVRASITWGSDDAGHLSTPVLLLIIDLHFTDKISGEYNLPTAAFRSVLSAPLIEVVPGP